MKTNKTMQNKPCACCGNARLDENSEFDICPVCSWQDDRVQNADPNYEGGANTISLNEARMNYRNFGTSEKRFLPQVKKLPK